MSLRDLAAKHNWQYDAKRNEIPCEYGCIYEIDSKIIAVSDLYHRQISRFGGPLQGGFCISRKQVARVAQILQPLKSRPGE